MTPTIQIINSNSEDLATIFKFYDHAVAHQKKVSDKHWQGFDEVMIRQEITEKRQYKILVDGVIGCIFAVTFNDPQIWEERDLTPSIYIHRIVTHPDFRGLGFVKYITKWAIDFTKANNLQFVRMDTWADNEKLIGYYKSFGFSDAGIIKIKADSGLPKHYEGISLQLFEIKV